MRRLHLLLVGLLALTTPGWAQPTTLTLLNTADEHGHLEAVTEGGDDVGGVAALASLWRLAEGYDPSSFLILSGGDNWTGPAISTWFEGAAAAEAMRLLDYQASAIGNHEFDFGREVMVERFADSGVRYLAANILDEAGEVAPFAEPYALFERQGVVVGVLGLTTRDTPQSTHPKNLNGLSFGDYLEAVERFVPEMRAQGAQVVIALTHICATEAAELALEAERLLDLVFLGHCNQQQVRRFGSVTVVGSGDRWQSYARVRLTIDAPTGELTEVDTDIVEVRLSRDLEPDPELSALVERWRARTDEALARPLGHSDGGLPRRSFALANLITDSWRWAYPSAEVAVTNTGGIRADLPAGQIELQDVVGVLPFENTLILVEVSGAELLANLECCGGALSGLRFERGNPILDDGQPLDPEGQYRVLINDFMYAGGDGYLFGAQDPEGYDTSIHWRQPLVDYLESLATKPESPLEDFVDDDPRGSY